MSDSSQTQPHRFKNWFHSRLPFFWDNWLAAAGSMLVLVSVFLMVLLFLLYLYNSIAGHDSNPYVDLIGFLVLPGFLVLGVILLLFGNMLRRSREKREGKPHTIDLGAPELIRKAIIVAVISFVVLIGVGLFSFEAYHYTDSNQFCSTVCHEVMAPEAAAHASSPHANVKCVDCHIGPGASWFVRAKLSGIRQVFAVLSDDFHRPIPTPVENLRPARDTCEICHWPSRFHGSRLVVHPRFMPDEENTVTSTALVLHVGGPDTPYTPATKATGIHWHIDPGNQVRYRHLDRERQEIVEVVQRTAEGEIRYLADGAEADTSLGTWRVMDCLDCHNRPTHIYDLPHRALDVAFAVGALDPAVPWLRKEAEKVLRAVEPGDDTEAFIAAELLSAYQADHPEHLAVLDAQLQPISVELARILERNVWPAMNITWGTYRSNLSHFDNEGDFDDSGCFRCHNEELTAESGATIEQDCDSCHAVLAVEEEDWAGLKGLEIKSFIR